MLNKCQYMKPARCGKETEGKFCEEHLKEKCRCGKQAIKACSIFLGPLMCGDPICDDCNCRKTWE